MRKFLRWMSCLWLIAATAACGWCDAPSSSGESLLKLEPAGAARGIPVVVEGRTLVSYRVALEFPDVAQRAKAAEERIVSALPSLVAGQLSIKPIQIGNERGYAVAEGPRFLLTVMEGDVDFGSGQTTEAVAAKVSAELRLLAGDRAARKPAPPLVRGLVQAGVATVAFGAFWVLVAVLRSRTLLRLAKSTRQSGHVFKVFGYDWRPLAFEFASSVIRLGVLAVLFAGAYVWLAYALSRFSTTQPWGERLGGYLLDAATALLGGALHQIPNFAALVVIYLVTRGLIRVLNSWFSAIESGRYSTAWLDPEAARATRRLADIGVWIVALIVAYPYLPGSHSEAFRGVSVFLGLMLSLGGAGFVGQVIGGLSAVYSRAVRSGDFIIVGDTQGVVKELGLLTTKVVTRNREEVTLPNSMLVSSAIRNLSRGGNQGTLLTTSVTIGYDAPWRQVEAMLLKAAAHTENLLQDPSPFVLQTALDDFYVRYELTAFAEAAPLRSVVLARLHGRIQDVFNENGVQIMSPHFLAQPDAPVVVPPEKWGSRPGSKS